MTQKKYEQNLHTPKKKFIFLKTPKDIEIQNLTPPPPPKKNSPSLRMYINIRVPPGVGMTKYID